MKDVFERILGFVPTYLRDLPRLLQSPKLFVRERLAKGERPLEDALVFLGISFLIGWTLETSFHGPDLMKELASDAAFDLIRVLAYGAVLYLAWWMVKGRADLQKFLVIHFYYSGVLILLLSCSFMALMGTFRAEDPNLYTEFLENIHRGNVSIFFKNNGAWVARVPAVLVVYSVGLLAALIWIVVGWGAYRELNHLSKARSAFAAGLFVFLWFPITALVFLIATAAVT